MPHAKKPTPAPANDDVVSTEVSIREGTSVSAALPRLPATDLKQIAFSQRIGERLGRKKLADAIAKLQTVSSLVELQQIKESRAYRGMSVVSDDGKLLTVSTWDDYCLNVEGLSRQHVDDSLMNLKTLGPSLLEAIQRLGLGHRELRAMRSISVDQQTELLEAAKTGDRSTFIDIAESLIEKHQAEKLVIEKRATEAEQIALARQRLLDDAARREEKLIADQGFKPSADNIARNATENQRIEALNAACLAVDLGVQRLAAVIPEFVGPYSSTLMQTYATNAARVLVLRIKQFCSVPGLRLDLSDEEIEVVPYLPRIAGLNGRSDADQGK